MKGLPRLTVYACCRWLSLGIHVVTPNKRLGSGPLADYLQVKEAQRRYGAHFLAEVRAVPSACRMRR